MIPRTPVKKARKKPRPGRLKGKDLEVLRLHCFVRDSFMCQNCHIFVDDRLPDLHDRKAHMAHIKVKRMGGDSLENVRTLCGKCHRTEHAYGPSMTKPVPKKPEVA